jgi:hypothetical protein
MAKHTKKKPYTLFSPHRAEPPTRSVGAASAPPAAPTASPDQGPPEDDQAPVKRERSDDRGAWDHPPEERRSTAAPEPAAFITGNGAMGFGMTGAGTPGAPTVGPGSGVIANGFGMAATAAAGAPLC